MKDAHAHERSASLIQNRNLCGLRDIGVDRKNWVVQRFPRAFFKTIGLGIVCREDENVRGMQYNASFPEKGLPLCFEFPVLWGADFGGFPDPGVQT